MRAGNMDGAPSGEKQETQDTKFEGELKLVTTLFGSDSFRIALKLYFHRVVIDLVHLVVGGVYLAEVHPSKDMRPVYLVVRGALSLLIVPISIAADSMGPNVSMKLIALKTTGSVFNLIRFFWLIYGTVLLTVPSAGGCDKPCSWSVVGSVSVDWAWAVLNTCALLFPVCWALTDQWSTYLFMIYAAIKKGHNAKSRSQVEVT